MTLGAETIFHSSVFVFPGSLTASDAWTLSIVMHGTWSGATPLIMMALLGLAQGEEVPLVPGKIFLHFTEVACLCTSYDFVVRSIFIILLCQSICPIV